MHYDSAQSFPEHLKVFPECQKRCSFPYLSRQRALQSYNVHYFPCQVTKVEWEAVTMAVAEEEAEGR